MNGPRSTTTPTAPGVSKPNDPLPALAGELARLDAETRMHIPKILADLKEAEHHALHAPTETARRTWEQAAHHLREARDRLRLGPFAPATIRGDRDDNGGGA